MSDLRPRLAELYDLAGRPSKGSLAFHITQLGLQAGASTLIAVPTGSGKLKWATVEAFVRACARHASGKRTPLPAEMIDLTEWLHLWEQDQNEKRAPRTSVNADAVAALGSFNDAPSIQLVELYRSGYADLIRDIAPAGGLHDRDDELVELAAFCAGNEPYIWWQAGPWAGKTALLATFVLNPPADIDVVSFFVTARLKYQSDSEAFTDALLGQFAALTATTIPSTPSAAGRESLRRALLTEAVNRSEAAGRRLVLVVDGLDEDRGSTAGSGMASIAELLPKVPGERLRVIVAGRPHPSLPDEVPADHPLRTCRIRPLAISPHATEIADRARAELARLLAGDRLDQDVVGLVMASGGGLTLDDFAELTGRDRYEIENRLSGVIGRTVTSRADITSTGPARVYLFGHDMLVAEAVERIGSAATGYRDRLHAWAASYRDVGWPTNTPVYLFGGYARLLRELGDLDRLSALAADHLRHNRMLAVTGGDAAALTEIRTVQTMLLSTRPHDVLTMALLGMRRDDLTHRNAHIPKNLPIVWAMLGNVIRADALARSLVSEYDQSEALTTIADIVMRSRERVHLEDPPRDHEVREMIAVGDVDAARSAIEEMTSTDLKIESLRALAFTLIADGHYEEAATVAADIEITTSRGYVLNALTHALIHAGDPDRAEAVACSIPDAGWRVRTVGDVALARIAAGDRERADDLLELARSTAYAAIDEKGMPWRTEALADLARVLANAGEHEDAVAVSAEAEAAIRRTGSAYSQVRVLISLIGPLGRAGAVDRVLTLANDVEIMLLDESQYVGSRNELMVSLLTALRTAGAHLRARELARSAMTAALDNSPAERIKALTDIGAAISEIDPAANETISTEVQAMLNDPDPRRQAEAATATAYYLASSGYADTARKLAEIAESSARQAADTDWLPHELAVLVATLGRVGNRDQAQQVADIAWQAGLMITNPDRRAYVLVKLLAATVQAGIHDLARDIAETADDTVRTMTSPDNQTDLITDLVRVYTELDDRKRIRALVEVSDASLTAIDSSDMREHMTRKVVATLLDADEIDLAEYVAQRSADPEQLTIRLAPVIAALAVDGQVDRAEALARTIPIPKLADQPASTAPAAGGRFEHPEELTSAPPVSASPAHDALEPFTAEIFIDDWEPRYYQAMALESLATTLAGAGHYDRALAIIETMADPKRHDDVLVAIVTAVAGAGNYRRAAAMADTLGNSYQRADAIVAVVKAMAVAGRYRQAQVCARRLAKSPHRLFRRAPRHLDPAVLGHVVTALVAAGQHRRAESLAAALVSAAMDDSYRSIRSSDLVEVLQVLTRAGMRERVHDILPAAATAATQMTPGESQVNALLVVVRGASLAHDYIRARELLRVVVSAIPMIRPYRQRTVFAEVLDAVGATDRAMVDDLCTMAVATAQTMLEADDAFWLLANLMTGLIDTGRSEFTRRIAADAETAAHAISAKGIPNYRAEAMLALAERLHAANLPEQGRLLVTEVLSTESWMDALPVMSHLYPDLIGALAAARLQ